ncbi:MAG: polysaccharide deacetylase family protein [Deltaproteobacteria bacterium]|nr:polysaccharide deacetylase family protein [Deltaproteobacteria bacterium]
MGPGHQLLRLAGLHRPRRWGADPAPLHGKVALTFDDGPHATVTPQILATLRAHNVPATFLMVGRKVDDPSLWNIADDIATDPLFDIGNHTWDHTDLALAAEAQVHWEVDDTTEAIESFGVTPAFFRFPFGDSTCRTSDIVREDHGPTGATPRAAPAPGPSTGASHRDSSPTCGGSSSTRLRPSTAGWCCSTIPTSTRRATSRTSSSTSSMPAIPSRASTTPMRSHA